MGHASTIWVRRWAAAFVAGSLVVTSFDARAADKLLVLQKASNDAIANWAGPDAQVALQTASGTTVTLVQDFRSACQRMLLAIVRSMRRGQVLCR